MPNPRKIFFMDRDGVINKEVGYLHQISKFIFIDGVINAMKKVISKDYSIIVVTNQSGIGRGLYQVEDYKKLNTWMIKSLKNEGIEILDTFFCPHKPEDKCSCRKPAPGMFFDAFSKYSIDIDKSWMIGDKEADITAARLAGINNTALVRSGHRINEEESKAKYIINSASDVLKFI